MDALCGRVRLVPHITHRSIAFSLSLSFSRLPCSGGKMKTDEEVHNAATGRYTAVKYWLQSKVRSCRHFQLVSIRAQVDCNAYVLCFLHRVQFKR